MRRYKTPRRPFSKLCSSLLCAYCLNKLPERGPTKHGFVYKLSINTQLRAWAHRRSAYTQLSPLYLLSTLYVTHVIKYSRPSTAFPYCKRRKAGRGLGTRLVFAYCKRSKTGAGEGLGTRLSLWIMSSISQCCYIRVSMSLMTKIINN